MRFSWIRARGVVVSAAIMALQGAAALAQFVPYTPNVNQGYNQYQAHTAAQPQAQPQYGQPQYGQPQYTAMAFQGSDTRGAMPSLSQPSEAVAPGQMMQAAPTQTYSAAPVQSYSPAPAAGCSTCQSSSSVPVASGYESYSLGGCTSGSCGAYNTFDSGCGVGGYGACGVGSGCGVGGGCGGCDDGCCGGGYLGCYGRGCGRRWFGGFYGLYMERAGNDWRALGFSTLDTNGPGYYPTDTEYVLNLQDLDQDTFAGAEVRFGSTFGKGRCGCGPRFGWEFAYWALDDETQSRTVTDTTTDGNRLYTMNSYTGLEYDPGSGYRSVNDYVDYAPPVSDYTAGGTLDNVELRSVTARSTFQMQNIEANILRLPVVGGPCGCGSRLQVTGVAGFRYIRLDDDFSLLYSGENTTTPGTYSLNHVVDVDSHLAGGQVGCNCCYNFGRCGRWGLHCNSVVGVFNNHIEVWNRMDGVRFANNGTPDFNLRYEDDSVSVLGELRVGGSYQYSCHCRFFGGYRLLGLTGLALAPDQALNQSVYSSANQVSYVDGNGSIFLHGLQGGVEWAY
ncbi:MAG: hypothetical protein AAGD11_18215 [Planctomycetota bacterium]